MNQLMISNLFAVKGKNLDNLTISDIRHAVIKGILYYNHRFKNTYGKTILCYDSRNYWRTKQFPNYKASRKKKQDRDGIDWHKIYGLFNIVREEVKSNFPFATMYIETIEADDIIAVLAKNYHQNSGYIRGPGQGKTVIVSSDKDFQQLQCIDGVEQYSPNTKDFMVCEDPIGFLIDHIIRGDTSDGIPNILSDDDTFICEDKKQTIMSSKRYNAILEEVKGRRICEEESKFRRNWLRNRNLIDLDCIPKDKKKLIEDEYDEEISSNYMKKTNPTSMEYLISNRLGNLTEFLI